MEWDTPLSRVEIESFVKSFLLFFSSLGLLIATLFYFNLHKEISTLDNELFAKMKVCSYDLKCEEFVIDFVAQDKQEFYTLYKDGGALQAYFPISKSDAFILKFEFSAKKYNKLFSELQSQLLVKLAGVLFVVLVLSVIFSLYALSPLRNALLLTQEFIKDILHDFNTPLASLRLNTSMLKKDNINKNKIIRIEQAVQNVLDLQENLRSYLHNHEMQKEPFEMGELIRERVSIIEKNYPDIEFQVQMEPTHIQSNKEAYSRIIDNLLSNAAKYNKKGGFVHIWYNNDTETLNIQDSGKGIKNPKKIFERFYKEQERGIGIGLHIVKKLCDELNIEINLQSELDVGTTFMLTLH